MLPLLERCWEVRLLSVPEFESAVNAICGDIRSGKERQETAEELLSHLEDVRDWHLACGASEEEACSRALDQLGDRLKLREQFARVHRFDPLLSMKGAILVLEWGVVFSLLSINIDGLQQWTHLLGSLLLLLSAFRLRRANKTLHRAWLAQGTVFALVTIQRGLQILCSLPSGLMTAFVAVTGLLTCFFWGSIFYGLDQLYKSHVQNAEKPPRLGFCGTVMVLFHVVMYVALGFSTANGITSANIESTFLVLALFVFVYYTVSQLKKVRVLLGATEGEYGIEGNTPRAKAVVAVALALSLIVPLVCQLGYAFRSGQTYRFVMHDLADSKLETIATETREKMVSDFSFPKEVLNDLPDSEVLQYRFADDLRWSKTESVGTYGALMPMTVYRFSLKKSYTYDEKRQQWMTGNMPCIRDLCVAEPACLDSIHFHGRNAFLAFFDNDAYYVNGISSGLFCSAVTGEGNSREVQGAIDKHDFDPSRPDYYGFSIREKDVQRLYLAMTYMESGEDDDVVLQLKYIRQQRPLAVWFQDIFNYEDLFAFGSDGTYSSAGFGFSDAVMTREGFVKHSGS